MPIAETASDTPRLVLRNTSVAPTEATPSSMRAAAVPVTSPYEHWVTWARAAVSKVAVQNLLTRTWLVGALAMIVLQLAWLIRLRLGLHKGEAPPSWLLDELQRLAEQLEVRPPRAVVLPIGSPLLVGGIRPTLVFPASLLEQLDPHGWKSVLAHELVHLKRRDHWTGWLELAAACLWWWNPLFWYARRRLRESAEYACDAWVVRLLPQNRRAYAESLITVVASLTRNPLPVASIGMAAHGRRIFERRLEMILREAVPHRLSRLAITGASLAALLMLPGWASPTASTPPRQLAELQNVTVGSESTVRMPDPPKAAKQEDANDLPKTKPIDLERRLSIEFENQHISGILDYLVEYCGVNVVTDPRVIAPRPAPQPDGPNPPVAPPPPAAEYATDGMVEYVLQEDVPLRKLLPALLRPLNLDYRPIGHVIFISTPENLEKAKPEPPRLEPGQEALAKKFIANASLEFETQNLHGILDYVRGYFDVDCHIDPEAKLPGTGQPATQAIVNYLRLEDIPLWEALYWISSPLGLTYAAKGDTVWITTPDRIAKLPPALHILDIQKAPQGGYIAQIRYGRNSPIWYVEGEEFEDYTVQKIDAKEKEVTVTWDNNIKTMQLCQE